MRLSFSFLFFSFLFHHSLVPKHVTDLTYFLLDCGYCFLHEKFSDPRRAFDTSNQRYGSKSSCEPHHLFRQSVFRQLTQFRR